MVEVRNNGVPLLEQAPKAAITQSVQALAQALCGDETATPPLAETGKTSVLSRLFSFGAHK